MNGMVRPFMHLISGRIVGKYKLSKITATPAVTAVYTEYISDLSKQNGNYPFCWETSQTCSGPFGDQYMATQMWHSSYSGPRGYGGWAYDGPSPNSFISQNWSIGCNYGTGYYTYYPVMYGWATNVGQGPTIRSDNQLNAHCGTTPP